MVVRDQALRFASAVEGGGSVTTNIFATTWWPLHVATAWVLTRDRGFTRQHSRVAGPSLLIGLEVALAATGELPRRSFESVEAAWTALDESMSSGRVRTVGTPFRRIANTSGGAVVRAEPQRQIPWQEIGSLEYCEDGDDQCLVPKDWRVARGSNWGNLCGYRDVQVHREDVLNHFPPSEESTLTSDMIDPPAAPVGGGFMRFSEAAYWIATEGGTKSFEVYDQAVWKRAYDDLIAHIASNEVQIIGQPVNGMNQKLDAHLFAGLRASYPFHDTPDELLFGSEPYIESFLPINDEHWRKGFDDKLVLPRGQNGHWSRLQVRKEDVRRIWQFPNIQDASLGSSDGHVDRTNSRRGRPPKIGWAQVKSFVHDRLDYHGVPRSDDPQWSYQADVERAVAKFIEDTFGTSMAESSIRKKTAKFIAEWQAGKGR